MMNEIMNKYIESDIEQGLKYLKCAIMNSLSAIEEGETDHIVLGEHVPFSLIVQCAEERNWKEDPNMDFGDWTNGWEIDCWYYMYTPKKQKVCISSCLWKGQFSEIIVDY